VGDRNQADNIILTGFMGTGKTTVGRLVAERLGYTFVDTDAIIEERHGPIALIFAERGEDAFREIERGVAAELAGRSGLVVSTGGRMMLDDVNAVALGRTGTVYCLVADPDEIHRRVSSDGSLGERPLLAGPDPRGRIVELLTDRGPGYGRFPQIETGGRSPDEIADEVAQLSIAGR
jgi:shikimate kinase